MTDGPELTPEDVKEILRVIDEAGYDEFELETPRFAIRLSRSGDQPQRAEHSPEAAAAPPQALVEITSPTVGRVYRSPAPGEPAFVEPGSAVEPGAQLCIVEVMKLMNAVTATVRGTVTDVCFEDGAAVEYGDVLFRIRPDA